MKVSITHILLGEPFPARIRGCYFTLQSFNENI